jgi:hypothetical protein
MDLKLKSAPFKIGDKVVTSYFEDEAGVPRTVKRIVKGDFETNYGVQADEGDACPHCGRKYSELPLLASSWFKGAPHD